MVAEPRIWVDVEDAVRAWAREALPAIEGRVFFGANNDAAMPQVVVSRIAGPDDRCLIQFDVWADAKAASAQFAADLATALDALGRYTHGTTLLHGARVEGVRWLPDDENDTPRHVVEATFTASATHDDR